MVTQAFDIVSDKAVSRAEHIVTKMVEHMPKGMLNRMHQSAADIAIIGKDQVTINLFNDVFNLRITQQILKLHLLVLPEIL